jgi:transcriptional regulator with XRE-family HTH domain
MPTPSKKFRKILNDLKRRPIDAAKDLGVSEKKIKKILNSKQISDLRLIEKAVKVWPVNYSDFFYTEDDTKNNYKIFKLSDANKSERIMYRGGKPYYSYKDTVMSKISPFRPEWIQELVIVKDNKPNNKLAKFNNGHFLHQFTYFIGPVNFYYIENNKKKVAKMNTGDSMYISPYVPHTFTTRYNKEKVLGSILALTYTDKIDGEILNELSAIGHKLVKKYKIDITNEYKSFYENLNYHLKASSISLKELNKITKLNITKKKTKIPNFDKLNKIAKFLNISLRDLLPPIKSRSVKIKKFATNRNWYYPSKEKRTYRFNELTNLPELPLSKAYEFHILKDINHNDTLEVPCHQYIFNIGKTPCKIKIDKTISEKLEPGDSVYLKPNLTHKFIGRGKLLVLRIGGKISGDVLYQMSMISDKNIKRLVDDNMPWFSSK